MGTTAELEFPSFHILLLTPTVAFLQSVILFPDPSTKKWASRNTSMKTTAGSSHLLHASSARFRRYSTKRDAAFDCSRTNLHNHNRLNYSFKHYRRVNKKSNLSQILRNLFHDLHFDLHQHKPQHSSLSSVSRIN
jgi:hypothetical protein